MFSLKDFVKTNLLAGFENGSFTMEQVNIFSANYLLKGVFTEADVLEVSEAMQPIEEEPENPS
jgi:hypothetical protein